MEIFLKHPFLPRPHILLVLEHTFHIQEQTPIQIRVLIQKDGYFMQKDTCFVTTIYSTAKKEGVLKHL